MRVGLVSDTHDNEVRTRAAIELFAREEIEALLHMGDLSSVRTLRLLEGWPAWIARGNTDEDPSRIAAAARLAEGPIAYGIRHEVVLDGVRFGMIHGDDVGRLDGMVASGAFDVVCHGHSHVFRDEMVGRTRVINPGAVHRSAAPSVCVFDTGRRRLERFPL